MDLKAFFKIFTTIFVAELGDKTQLATFLFAANPERSKWTVFIASALALVAATGIAVLLGSVVAKYVNPKYLSYAAGAGFIIIGIWSIVKA